MSKKNTIQHISISQGEGAMDLKLTIEEARELYDELHKIFGKNQAQPVITIPQYTPPNQWPSTPNIWCGGATSGPHDPNISAQNG